MSEVIEYYRENGNKGFKELKAFVADL